MSQGMVCNELANLEVISPRYEPTLTLTLLWAPQRRYSAGRGLVLSCCLASEVLTSPLLPIPCPD